MEKSIIKISCDKITIIGKYRTRVQKWHKREYNRIERYIRWLGDATNDSNYELTAVSESERLCSYRYMTAIKRKDDIEGVLTLFNCWIGGYNSNNEQGTSRDSLYAFKIEFNPNKSGMEIYKLICEYFILDVKRVKNFDLAFDIPNRSIQEITYLGRCEIMTYGTIINKTHYIAPKEHKRSGRIKIYQKDAERETKGKAIEKTLRIEVTFIPDELDFFSDTLHNRQIQDYQRVCDRLRDIRLTRVVGDDWQLYALSRLKEDDLHNALSLMASATRTKYRALLKKTKEDSINFDAVELITIVNAIINPLLKMGNYKSFTQKEKNRNEKNLPYAY